MATPITTQLRRAIADLEYKLRSEKDARLKLEGKLERYEEIEKKTEESQMNQVYSERQYKEELENQIVWMRRLVEDLCLPKDKLEILRKQDETIVTNSYDNMLQPSMKKHYR